MMMRLTILIVSCSLIFNESLAFASKPPSSSIALPTTSRKPQPPKAFVPLSSINTNNNGSTALSMTGGSDTPAHPAGDSNDLDAIRGGGSTNKPLGKVTSKEKLISLLSLLSVLGYLGVNNRHAIASFEFKKWLSVQLDTLSNLGTPGLILYIIFFMLWEITVGITTPVETAAGMAFGLEKGIIANALGKTSGALCAFLLGRYILKDFATKKLEGNEYMILVRHSIRKNPIRVSLIWRFSFLPEFVKNFGLSILPVKTWQFATAVFMHGFPFTILWTFMGNEMGAVVRGVSEPSKILKGLLIGVYVFGFFISPSLVALWVKSLRNEDNQSLK